MRSKGPKSENTRLRCSSLWLRKSNLPHAAESHGDRLAVHAPGSVAAQERDHLRDLARLQHPVLRVDGGALAPYLLNADAVPFGFRLCRALGHGRPHPAGQHRVGCDSERTRVLGDRACEPDDAMLGGGVRASRAFRFLAGGGTGENGAAESALANAASRQPREPERSVEVDAYRLAPDLGILLPHEPLVSRADAVVYDQHVNRPQPPRRLGHGQGAALGAAEVRRDVVQANGRELGRAARHDHHARPRCGQQQRRLAPDTPTAARYQRHTSIHRQAPVFIFLESSHAGRAGAIARASESARSERWSGLCNTSFTPMADARCARLVPPWPLIRMIGISGRRSPISRASSVPTSSGIASSVRMRSKRFGFARKTSSATRLDSKPTGS